MAFVAKSSQTVIQPPPRVSGNAANDQRSLIEWLHGFFRAGVLESGLLDAEYQASGADEIDYNDLPDPAATTIARAQGVANAAYRKTSGGQFTVSGAVASISLAFAEPLAEGTTFKAVATASAFTGAPPAGAFTVAAMNKTVTGVAFTLVTAPGVGASVTFDYILILDE
jgi:hypothetical protein